MCHVAIFNIRNQWQDPEILIFAMRISYEKIGHMMEALMQKFRPDAYAHLKDIDEKQVSAKLELIVGSSPRGS